MKGACIFFSRIFCFADRQATTKVSCRSKCDVSFSRKGNLRIQVKSFLFLRPFVTLLCNTFPNHRTKDLPLDVIASRIYARGVRVPDWFPRPLLHLKRETIQAPYVASVRGGTSWVVSVPTRRSLRDRPTALKLATQIWRYCEEEMLETSGCFTQNSMHQRFVAMHSSVWLMFAGASTTDRQRFQTALTKCVSIS